MSGRFEQKSVAGGIANRLYEEILRRDTERRQQMLDGIAIQDRLREQARLDAEQRRRDAADQRAAERQDAEDRQKAADRLLTFTRPDQDLTSDQAATFRAGGVPVESRSTLPARTGSNPFAPNTLEAVLYDRRPETATERVQREAAAAKRAEAEDARKARADEADANREFRAEQAQASRADRQAAEANADRRFQQSQAAAESRFNRTQANRTENAKPTQSQLAADAFYTRAKEADDALDDIDNISLTDRYAPNFMQSDTGQRYQQARRQFTEAYLRKDSGAAISDAEYSNADRTYFPQYGDSPKTLARKREARNAVLESLRHQGSGTTGTSGGGLPAGVTVRRVK